MQFLSLCSATYAIFDNYVPVDVSSSDVARFQSKWCALGPFQIGTREAAWGADPLQYYGGFSTLTPKSHPKVPSAFAIHGEATWKDIDADSTANGVQLNVSFSETDWDSLRHIYGWAALQWQAWVKGFIAIEHPDARKYLLYTDNVVEFEIKQGFKTTRHFGGDFFAYRRAPLVLDLKQGICEFNVRLIRDVRSMGGLGNPDMIVKLELFPVIQGLYFNDRSLLVSDVVNNVFANSLASIAITNIHDHEVVIDSISSDDTVKVSFDYFEMRSLPIRLNSGQTRPLNFNIELIGFNYSSAQLTIHYHQTSEPNLLLSSIFSIPIRYGNLYEAHKVTHRHTSGTTSYSILRPPSKEVQCSQAAVLLQLHGAGVEADGPLIRESFDGFTQPCAFILSPSGMTTWSGDDWHSWGSNDALAAIEQLKSWPDIVSWKGPQINSSRIVVTGHSNGGQGTWQFITHSTSVVAAAPLSGYLSIQAYVPYSLWSPADPRKMAVQQASLSDYNHELLAPMLKGIPLYQQHGQDDNNVPAYHSRRIHQLIAQSGWSSNYSEVPNRNHWWDNVMTTKGIRKFFSNYLKDDAMNFNTIPQEFEIVVANPSRTFPKYGIKVLYLEDQGRLGRLQAKVNNDGQNSVWRIVPENILAFEFEPESNFLNNFEIPGYSHVTKTAHGKVVVFTRQVDIDTCFDFSVHRISSKDKSQEFLGSGLKNYEDRPIRRPEEFGGLEVILNAIKGSEFVVSQKHASFIAKEVARNLYQYFGADTVITEARTDSYQLSSPEQQQPYIVVTSGACSFEQCFPDPDFPIKLVNNHLQVRDSNGYWTQPGANNAKLGAIFVRPGYDGVEMVIWGDDSNMLAQASRLMPMMTGTGQPDFIIVREDAAHRGLDGTYLGFFDAWWNITRSSVV